MSIKARITKLEGYRKTIRNEDACLKALADRLRMNPDLSRKLRNFFDHCTEMDPEKRIELLKKELIDHQYFSGI